MSMRVFLVLCLVLVPVMAHAQVTNLALNPSFEEDEVILDDPDWYSWGTWGDGDGLNSTIELDGNEFIDGARSLKINPKGAENWHFIVLNLPIPVTLGDTYTASFWAKASGDRPLGVQIKATDNSVSFAYNDFTLTTEWSEYSFTFPTESNDIKVEFFCAASDVSFWLDYLNVYAGDYVADVLPSEMRDTPVESVGKLATQWGSLKLAR